MIREANPLVTCRVLLAVTGLSNDATYAKVLFETFGSRVIGLQISRLGDGTNFGRRVHSIKLDHAARPTCPELPQFSESRHCLTALASDASYQ